MSPAPTQPRYVPRQNPYGGTYISLAARGVVVARAIEERYLRMPAALPQDLASLPIGPIVDLGLRRRLYSPAASNRVGINRRLLDIGQDRLRPGVGVPPSNFMRGNGQLLLGGSLGVQGPEGEILEVVLQTRRSCLGRLTGRLDGRQQQRDQDADDRDDHQCSTKLTPSRRSGAIGRFMTSRSFPPSTSPEPRVEDVSPTIPCNLLDAPRLAQRACAVVGPFGPLLFSAIVTASFAGATCPRRTPPPPVTPNLRAQEHAGHRLCRTCLVATRPYGQRRGIVRCAEAALPHQEVVAIDVAVNVVIPLRRRQHTNAAADKPAIVAEAELQIAVHAPRRTSPC